MAARLLSCRIKDTVASSSNSIKQICIGAPGKAHCRLRRENAMLMRLVNPIRCLLNTARPFSASSADLQSSRLLETEMGPSLSSEAIERTEIVSKPNQDVIMNDTSMRVLFDMDRSLVQYISDPNELENLVSKIEKCFRLTSVDVESWVHPLMLATSNLKSFDGAVLSERLLAKCLDLVGTQERRTIDDYDELPYPSAEMYNMAISAWISARTKDCSGAERATQLLEVMSDEYRREREWVKDFNESHKGETRRVRSARPDIINYTTVMNAWAKSGTKRGILRAQGMLDELENLSGVSQELYGNEEKGTEHSLSYLTPDQACYNVVITGWSRSFYPEAIQSIERLLQRMDTLYELSQDTRFQPDTQSFHMLISAYAKAAQQLKRRKGNQASLQAALRAENVLRIMHQRYQEAKMQGGGQSDIVRPDVMVYNAVINAWAKSASLDGAYRAESILLRMLGMANEDSDFPIVEGVLPNTITFNTVIHAWAESGHAKAGQRAERLLKLMEFCCSDEVHPNTITFNAIMNAWSRSKNPEAGERAELILNHMLELGGDAQPNVISFSTAIFAWARSGDDEGALRAEILLDRIEKLHRESKDESSLEPNEACYEGVMFAWSIRSGNRRRYDGLYAAERAEAVLQRMKEVGGLSPGTKQYNHVLNAWRKHESDASSNDGGPNKVHRANLLIQQMSRMTSSPADVVSYNYMIATCASPVQTAEGKREALFVALDAYNRLCESRTSYPNNQTYYMLSLVCTKLLPSTSDAGIELFEKLFHECCNDGLLSNDFLKIAREYLPPWSMQKLIGPEYGMNPIYVRDLPREWSRNCTPSR